MTNTNEHNNQGSDKKEGTKIFVNMVEIIWPKKSISFEELVNIAYPNSANMEFDITWTRPNGKEGELLEGKSEVVHTGMEFIVTPTNES